MGYSDYSDDDDGDDHYQFNEDDLNDAEYDLLYDLLPSFKSQVVSKNYKIDDLVLKEYLWESNFNVDDAMQLVLDNHKRMYQCFVFHFLPFLSISFHFFHFFHFFRFCLLLFCTPRLSLFLFQIFPSFFPFHVHLSRFNAKNNHFQYSLIEASHVSLQ